MITKELRIETERAVLGAVLLEDKYQVAAKFLTPQNFLLKEHQLVFETLQSFYPLKPNDILSLSRDLSEKYPSSAPGMKWGVFLSELVANVISTANLEYQSLLVLEWDIIQKFLDLLNTQLQSLESNVFKSAVLEVIGMVKDPEPIDTNSKLDSLSLVEQGFHYLKSINYPDELLKPLAQFSENITLRINKSKRMIYFDTLINQLFKFCEIGSGSDRREAIRRCTNIIISLGFSMQVPSDYLSKIKSLEEQFA